MEKKAILCVDDEIVILLSLIQELRISFGDRFIYEKALNGDDAMLLIDELAEEGVSGNTDHLGLAHASPDVTGNVIKNNSVLAVIQKPWNTSELVRLIEEKCV